MRRTSRFGSLMIPWIDASDPNWDFPAIEQALDEPDGLLAAGADLTPMTLLRAYRRGIFPWYSQGQPILWWSPNPRAVFFPPRAHVSRRLRRTLRSGRFDCRVDQDFAAIIADCAQAPRRDQDGTWITDEMLAAYLTLHQLGHAHCVGVYQDDALCGGIYGVAIGRAFFGESMFSRRRDASKVALVHLCKLLTEHQFGLLDAQVESGHILRMGAQLIDRRKFIELLDVYCARPGLIGSWRNLTLPVQSPRFVSSKTRTNG